MTALIEPLRCEVTGNPTGTDTRPAGRPCPCRVCTPSLTTEQARELAARWAAWQSTVGDWPELAVLTEAEREQLFAWVRVRMDGAAPVKVFLAEMIGRVLGWGNDGREPVYGTGGGAPDEMEAWFADAWALCEAAGWPS